MKIMHHKENSMVEVLQNNLNVSQILTWQLQNIAAAEQIPKWHDLL